jgi:hypothetical protein
LKFKFKVKGVEGLKNGGWRMEDGGWRMEDGGWRIRPET